MLELAWKTPNGSDTVGQLNVMMKYIYISGNGYIVELASLAYVRSVFEAV